MKMSLPLVRWCRARCRRPVHPRAQWQRFPLQLDGFDLPVDPAARLEALRAMTQAAQAGDDRLHRLLERQPTGLPGGAARRSHQLRRFFDISSLAALRMEDPAAFAAVHALPLRWWRPAWSMGCASTMSTAGRPARLPASAAQLDSTARAPPRAGRERPLLVVEKILAHDDVLHLRDWACDGTTGYDFMDQVGALLHDPSGEPVLRRLWQDASGRSGDFAEEERTARDEILAGSLQPEFERAVRGLVEDAGRAVPAERHSAALGAVMREFPVYRTYARRDGLDAHDAGLFAAAVAARARASRHRRCRRISTSWKRAWSMPPGLPARVRLRRRRLRQRIEQLSAPLTRNRWKTPRSIATACCCRQRGGLGSGALRAWGRLRFHPAPARGARPSIRARC